ncbi:hypothetical protein, partial [Streptococcus pneumoniae]|uniref:hypothetical protein n=1 Tax=Streptococcus pneumoniae TaxID=1313 RepID=UPI00214D2126
QLTNEQLFWLQYLLNLSQTNNLVKIKKIEEHKYDYKNQYYLQLANVTAKKLIENYDTLEEIDFALGKSGVLLSLIKYYQFTNDNTLKTFIHNSIWGNLSLFPTKRYSQRKHFRL